MGHRPPPGPPAIAVYMEPPLSWVDLYENEDILPHLMTQHLTLKQPHHWHHELSPAQSRKLGSAFLQNSLEIHGQSFENYLKFCAASMTSLSI